jgi:hypothetical protein
VCNSHRPLLSSPRPSSALRDAEAEKAKYAEVPAVYAAVDAARAELAQAMGNEVQVARLVANLAAIMPPSVSLTQVSMIIGPEDEADTVAKATDEAVAPLVGTVTFSGEAATFTTTSPCGSRPCATTPTTRT